MDPLVSSLMDVLSKENEKDTSISFSGGMDSLLLAICMRNFSDPRCIVAGTPLSEDVANSRKIAPLFDLRLEVVEMNIQDYKRLARKVAPMLKDPIPMKLNLTVTMAAVAERAGGGVLYMGHGADEIFYGYRKYARVDDRERRTIRSDDIERLLTVDIPDYEKVSELWDVSLNTPFLSEQIKALSGNTPGKQEVKDALTSLGVPKAVIREKRAMQFGSGVSKLLKTISKMNQSSL